MIAPILAEKVLPSPTSAVAAAANISSTPILDDSIQAILSHASNDSTVQIVPVSPPEIRMFDLFNPIQALYLAIGFFTFLIAICFLAGIQADRKTGSYSIGDKAKSLQDEKESQVNKN